MDFTITSLGDKIATANQNAYQQTVAKFLEEVHSRVQTYKTEVLKASRTHIVNLKASESALQGHVYKLEQHVADPSMLKLTDLVNDVHHAEKDLDLFHKRSENLEKSIVSSKWSLFKECEEVQFSFTLESVNRANIAYFIAKLENGLKFTICISKTKINEYAVKVRPDEFKLKSGKIICGVSWLNPEMDIYFNKPDLLLEIPKIEAFFIVNSLHVGPFVPLKTNITLVLTICTFTPESEENFKGQICGQLQQCIDQIQLEPLQLPRAEQTKLVEAPELEKVQLRKLKFW